MGFLEFSFRSKLRYPFKSWDQVLPAPLNPLLDYLAPEYALSTKCDCSSDMFSYGMLFYAVYNSGKPFYRCDGNFNTFAKNCDEVG
jgi:SCY1-like protein 2